MPQARVVTLFKRRTSTGPAFIQRSDDELMSLARAGIREAFAELVARYVDGLVSFCAKLTGDRRAAEEIAQETWLALWQGRDRYVPDEKFALLLYIAARNKCRNAARDRQRKSRWLVDDDAAGLTSSSPDELDRMLEGERRKRVHAALGVLPTQLREALVLRFGEELSYQEIARVLDTRESTIRSRVHYGIKAIREVLRRGTQ
jgi:RNA polymerase sigma-70 factor (ECF subfamily)